MYIGQLNAKNDALAGSYQFFGRGTQIPFPPDLVFDSNGGDTGEIAFGKGSLCGGSSVGWRWNSVMDTGVDVRFRFDKDVFLGAVCIELAERSAVQSVEVYSVVDAEAACVGRFDAQTGGLVSGELTISIGVRAKEFIVRFQADLKDIVISQLALIGAESDETRIYPTPAEVEYGVGQYSLSALRSIAALGSSPDTEFAAAHLRERFIERLGIDLPITSTSSEGSVSIAIDDSIDSEGYKVCVHSDGIELLASRRLSLLYAAETLIQLISDGALPYCEINDAPRVPVRGFHFGLPPREELDFARRFIRYVLLPLRYNTVFIEFAGGMRFDRHPEISEAWVRGNEGAKAGKQPPFPHGEMVAGGGLLEKEEVREFVDYIKAFGFEVIPEVQSFGHVQYINYAHPDIAEVAEGEADEKLDTRSADQPPSTYYHHSYCPLHEKSYELIYDIIDEIVEVVRPERYVHMGHDEIYQIGLCPRCRDKDHADLYTLHVTRMYEYLAKKGLKMMIWCDMLQPTERRYKTQKAIERLPRDIVMLDFIWYFHFDLDMEDHILPYGYKVIMGNMYSSHYPRFEQRIVKEGMIGGEVSTWCRFDEYTLAKKGKIFDAMYSAEMLWSETYDLRAREVYTAWIAKRMPRLRDELRGIAKPVGHPVSSEAIALPVAPNPRLPVAVAEALRRSAQTLGHCAFDFTGAQRLSSAPIEIPVSGHFQKLVFLHATANNAPRIAWKPLVEVGRYVVRYADGSQVSVPVEYAGNICVYTRRYGAPLPQQYYRHQGYIATYWGDPLMQAKSEDGRDVTALGFEWVNPYPEREIASIVCFGSEEADADILLLGISGIRTS